MVMIHRWLHSCPNLLPHHCETDKKTRLHSDHKLLPMNSCWSEVEFYYWKRPTLESTADGIVGKHWRPTQRQAHVNMYAHAHMHWSQMLPQAINTGPVTSPKHTPHPTECHTKPLRQSHSTAPNHRTLPPTEETTWTHMKWHTYTLFLS